ncbi:MAG: tetratricopeptide repeat protein [Bacteroidales bacterium]|nr:tetratricopeptide repeat protein [Bacteroidales bacterium]
MNRTFQLISLFVLLALGTLQLSAQQTVYNDPPQETYRQAMVLFGQQNYGAAREMFSLYMQQQPDKSNSFYENARYYSVAGSIALREKDALIQVQQFVSAYPESVWLPTIQFELGKLYFGSNKYRLALEAFGKVSPAKLTKTQRAEYYYKKGYCQLKLSKPNPALKSFSKVSSTKSPYAKPAKYYTAHIYYQQEKYDRALTGFKALENDRKYSKLVPVYLINIYYKQGDYKKVINEGSLYSGKADRKSKGEIARLVANAYYNLNDYGEAAKYFGIYEPLAKQKKDPDEQYRIGYAKFSNREYKGAIRNFQNASSKKGGMEQNAWYHLGFCYLETGEQKFARNAFLKAYKLNTDPEVTTDALYNYVKLTIEMGGDPLNDPVTIINTFLEQNPDGPRTNEAYDLLAQIYLTSNNYSAALQSIEKSGRPNRKLSGVYQQLAYWQGVEYFNRNSYTDAIDYFDKALLYTPDKPLKLQTIFWKADALYRQKQFAAAASGFRNFLQSSGARQSELYGMAAYNLAYSTFNQKQYQGAIKGFQQFLKQSGQRADLVSDAKLRLADSYFILKNYQTAMNWYQQVIEQGGRNADYALYQKAFCYGALGSFGQKVKAFYRLVSNYQKSILYADALYEMASTYSVMNNQREAIVYYDKLVKEKPRSSYAKKALVKMGFLYYNNNQYDRAITTLKQVVDKYPASLEAKEALNTLQNIYMDKGQVDAYFAYAKTLDFVQVSISEEDSLTFTTGENYFLNNDCGRAVPAFQKYLQQFPDGGFVLSATHYLSVCAEKQGDPETALGYYEKILSFPENQYTVPALLKVARANYDKEKYAESYENYQQLYELAESKGMVLEAADGMMRCAFLNKDYTDARLKASALLQTENVSEDQIVYAHYVLARSALELQQPTGAEKEFRIVDQLSSTELGAEAKYEVALNVYRQNKLDEAETIIYEMPAQYPGYDYWIAKSFILLADIYVARDNVFQAEQTLSSVIENYPGDDLKEVARGKLHRLKPPEEEQPDTMKNEKGREE